MSQMSTVGNEGEVVVDLDPPSWTRWVFMDVSAETSMEDGQQATRSQLGMALRNAQQDYRRMRAAFVAQQTRFQNIANSHDRLRGDLELIANALREEALRRDWCSEYGDWIEGVNSSTSEEWLMHCTQTDTRTYTVEVTLTARNGYLNDGFATIANTIQCVGENDGLDGIEEVNVLVRPQG
jgi:hypothetical protein